MNRFLTTLLLLCAMLSSHMVTAQDHLSALIPMPNHIEQPKGKPFRIVPGRTTVYCPHDSLHHIALLISRNIERQMGVAIEVSDTNERGAIVLHIDSTIQGREHYRLAVSARGLTLSGCTAEALYRGATTLNQLLLGDVCTTLRGEVQPIVIDDQPRFPYRALMLDPARHFLPVEDIEFFIDQMAKYKYNVLQLHLTDDQGWRVAIHSHPHLASRQHYTHDDLRHIIAYAAKRHIEVIPEVDIPGHTVAILSAYPELSCTHRLTDTVTIGSTTNRMVCAANAKSYDVLSDVIGELAELFPASHIHLGGDEAAVPVNWAQCPDCKELMHEYGYTEASQLMKPFFDRILSTVRQCGKRAIFWCELDNIYPPASEYLFPYPEDVTLVTWRYGLTPTCQTLTYKHGHQLIMAPGEYAYLDYPQWRGDLPEYNNWGMPLSTLENCYKLDPGYGRVVEEQRHILGVMGTLWGEAIPDINRATYMAFPRALALAEAGWTQMEHRSWDSFKTRLFPNLTDLMQCGVSVRVPFEIVKRKGAN